MREGAGGTEIFDALRKRWVKLSPEEWVRQNMVQYLLEEKSYPAALIGVEKEIKLGSLRKRFDLLVYDRAHQPWMLLECKAMEVPLSTGCPRSGPALSSFHSLQIHCYYEWSLLLRIPYRSGCAFIGRYTTRFPRIKKAPILREL